MYTIAQHFLELFTREEARNIVKESCGGCDDDVVIFCGSGSTGAIHKLVHAIVEERDPSPVVILGPFEHHSNILPWRNVAHKVYILAHRYEQTDMIINYAIRRSLSFRKMSMAYWTLSIWRKCWRNLKLTKYFKIA